MSTLHVIPARDRHNIHEKLSLYILGRVMEKPDLSLSVFAGEPAFGLFEELVSLAQKAAIDLSRVRFLVFDELITQDGKAPFKENLDAMLFRPLSVPQENIVWFDPGNDPELEAKRIAKWVDVVGIDIMLLSVDFRGHIGFHTSGSEPSSPAGLVEIESKVRWQTERAFTLGLKQILAANTVLLFASGIICADIVRDIAEGSYDLQKPVAVFQHHPRVIFIADEEALSKLQRSDGISGYYAGIYIVNEDNLPEGKTILVVSPHPDDAAISMGGAAAMLSTQNRVVVAVMTTGHRAFIYGKRHQERILIRESEVKAESKILGTEPVFLRLPFYDHNYEIGETDWQRFMEVLEEIGPHWVFLPHENDTHPAHLAAREIALQCVNAVSRKAGHSIDLWSFEGPWAVFNKGGFNALFSIPPQVFEKKLRAVRCHTSQLARTAYDVAADSLARLRSSLVPELSLAGFGRKPPKLEPYVELFTSEESGSILQDIADAQQKAVKKNPRSRDDIHT